jgi:hypothetical protein
VEPVIEHAPVAVATEPAPEAPAAPAPEVEATPAADEWSEMIAAPVPTNLAVSAPTPMRAAPVVAPEAPVQPVAAAPVAPDTAAQPVAAPVAPPAPAPVAATTSEQLTETEANTVLREALATIRAGRFDEARAALKRVSRALPNSAAGREADRGAVAVYNARSIAAAPADQRDALVQKARRDLGQSMWVELF